MNDSDRISSLSNADELSLGAMEVSGIAEVKLLWKMENLSAVPTLTLFQTNHHCLGFSFLIFKLKGILKILLNYFSNIFELQEFKEFTRISMDSMFFSFSLGGWIDPE